MPETTRTFSSPEPRTPAGLRAGGGAGRPERAEDDRRGEHRAGRARRAPARAEDEQQRHEDGDLDAVRDDPQARPPDRDRERLRPAPDELQRRREEHEPRRVRRVHAEVGAVGEARSAHGISTQRTGTATTISSDVADDVAAEHRRTSGRAGPASKSRVCSVSSTSRAGAPRARRSRSPAPARCGSSRPRRSARPSGSSAVPSVLRAETSEEASVEETTKRRRSRAIVAERLGRRRREPPERASAGDRRRRRRDDLRDDDRRSSRPSTPYSAADRRAR